MLISINRNYTCSDKPPYALVKTIWDVYEGSNGRWVVDYHEESSDKFVHLLT